MRSASDRTWPGILGTLIAGESLTAGEAAWAMDRVMDGTTTPAQVAGLAVALRAKGETPAELAGMADAMLARAVPIQIPGRVIDLVGTGGDGAGTFNISTAAAVVAAAAGVRVVKHGNRAASSRCGSADVLEALGVRIDLPAQASAELAADVGIAYLFAPSYYPALRHAAAARRELGVPTVFNFLGPIVNPARPQGQAVGVGDLRMAGLIAGVLAARGTDALVFQGDDGLDELTTVTTSAVWLVRSGTVSKATLDPRELGVPAAQPQDLLGGDAARNAAIIWDVLGGKPGAPRDIVLLNAAAAITAADGVPVSADLPAALAIATSRAAAAVDSGAAMRLLARWAAATWSQTAHNSAARPGGPTRKDRGGTTGPGPNGQTWPAPPVRP